MTAVVPVMVVLAALSTGLLAYLALARPRVSAAPDTRPVSQADL